MNANSKEMMLTQEGFWSGIKTSILISLSGVSFFSCSSFFFSAPKAYARNIKNQPFDAIIVPGCPYTGSKWSMVMELRITWTNYLYKKGYAKNIIFSGSSVHSPYVESRIMKLYAVKLGIPAENIYTEETAEHSTENIYYSYVMARKMGFKKIALASDPFQTRNLRPFLKKFEIPLVLLPALFDTLRANKMQEPQIDSSSEFIKNFIPLKKREGFFRRFGGTLGKHIIWHEEDLKKKKFKRRFKHRMVPTQPK